LEHDGKKYDLKKNWGENFSLFCNFFEKKLELERIKAYIFQQISFTFLYQS
jgi:hypothetical protein